MGDADGKKAEPKMVNVSEEYLTFLHDEISENHSRLRELLGESQAAAIMSWSADKLLTTVGGKGSSVSPLEGIIRKLQGWGLGVEQKDRGRYTELEVKCPYAESIHPKMASENPICPLGELVLGAVRLDDTKSQIAHNDLLKDGVRLTIAKSK